jgi:hypothetical protein
MSTRRITEAFPKEAPAATKAGPKAEAPARGLKTPQADGAAPSPAEVDDDEATLRQFDLDTRFGPVSGMSRLERHARAQTLGLNPPSWVPELVAKHGGESSAANKHLFEPGKV